MKVTFLNGASLDPPPPVGSKDPDHIHDDGAFDEERMRDWIRQASALPGWDGF